MGKSRRRILSALMVAALIASTSATAAGPDIARISFEDTYVDTMSCPGLELVTQLEAHVTVKSFSATRAQVHQRFIYSVAANGKGFTDNETFTEFANPASGVSKFSGTPINIQVAGHGNVLADRGTTTIDFTTDPWTILHEGGPHPFLHGDYGPLCAYLMT